MILNAAITCCIVAPPPTSKKFAGSPPCSLIMSMVAIAKPAPFTSERVHVIEMKYHLIAIIIYKWYRIYSLTSPSKKRGRSFRLNVSYSRIVNKQTKKTNKTSTIKLHVSIYTTVAHIARHSVTILSQPKSEKLDLKKVFILHSAHNWVTTILVSNIKRLWNKSYRWINTVQPRHNASTSGSYRNSKF